jgi:hypothetical protein
MDLLLGLQKHLVDEPGVFSCRYHFAIVSMFIYHLGMNNRPFGGRSSETCSYLVDMIIIIIIITPYISTTITKNLSTK